MDILSDIFDTTQLSGTLYFRTDFSPPWGTTVPPLRGAMRFHYVANGSCWLRVADGDPVLLEQDDLALIPAGAAHALSSKPDGEVPPLEQVLQRSGYDGKRHLVVGGQDRSAATQLVCGHFDFLPGTDHPLLRALPACLVIEGRSRAKRRWLYSVLDLLSANLFDHDECPTAVINRLSEIVLVEALRSAGDEAPLVRQMILAFADPAIGAAIRAIHTDYHRHWTVDALARTIGMSRTRFANRFRDLMGVTPIAYLAEWRLQHAAALLSSSRRRVAEIAFDCGYDSTTAFSRAFTARFGRTPTEWRTANSRN